MQRKKPEYEIYTRLTSTGRLSTNTVWNQLNVISEKSMLQMYIHVYTTDIEFNKFNRIMQIYCTHTLAYQQTYMYTTA